MTGPTYDNIVVFVVEVVEAFEGIGAKWPHEGGDGSSRSWNFEARTRRRAYK